MNIYVDNKDYLNKANIYAQMTGCILTEGTPDLNAGVPCLWLKEEGLTLVGESGQMTGDFTKMIPRLKKNNLLIFFIKFCKLFIYEFISFERIF